MRRKRNVVIAAIMLSALLFASGCYQSPENEPEIVGNPISTQPVLPTDASGNQTPGTDISSNLPSQSLPTETEQGNEGEKGNEGKKGERKEEGNADQEAGTNGGMEAHQQSEGLAELGGMSTIAPELIGYWHVDTIGDITGIEFMAEKNAYNDEETHTSAMNWIVRLYDGGTAELYDMSTGESAYFMWRSDGHRVIFSMGADENGQEQVAEYVVEEDGRIAENNGQHMLSIRLKKIEYVLGENLVGTWNLVTYTNPASGIIWHLDGLRNNAEHTEMVKAWENGEQMMNLLFNTSITFNEDGTYLLKMGESEITGKFGKENYTQLIALFNDEGNFWNLLTPEDGKLSMTLQMDGEDGTPNSTTYVFAKETP